MKKVKNPLRQVAPKRTCTKSYAAYGSFKKYLKKDFNSQCGYCADTDSWMGYRHYHIDHFVPRDQLKKISENSYKNLVYSCFSCNNSKSDDWPSGNEKVAIVGSQGYIDPCDTAYDEQYYRDEYGNILAVTDIGKYMYEKLNLGLRRHSVMWVLDNLDSQIKILKSLKNMKGLSASNKTRLSSLLEKHHEYTEYLKDENNR